MRSISKISKEWSVAAIFAICGIGGMICAIANTYAKDTHWPSLGALFFGISGVTYLILSIGALQNREWARSYAKPNAPRWLKVIGIVSGTGMVLGSVLVELGSLGIF